MPTVEYTLSLQDRVSAKLRQITLSSKPFNDAFESAKERMAAADRKMNETGRSLSALRDKIEALRAEREWIPSSNRDAIREYNKEIKSLGDEIDRVEKLTSGQSNLSRWTKEITNSIPGIGLLKNPVVLAGTAIAATAKSAMTFEKNMAQANTTTQYSGEELENLKTRIRGVANEFGADASMAPLGFDLINSQLNDADKSLNVLQASIKGSKAGFTDLNTVASALAQTVSLLGDTNANEVLDVFFASKRTGAVDFNSLAHYMPKLLSTGVGMGIDYKDVAGSFAYLTGKGQSAEQATVMLENAMSMLGKGDVRNKMAAAGVKVFDENGKMRGMTDIFGDLSSLMNGRSDEDRSKILEAFGVVDKEAKGAFNVLMSDMEKYKTIIDDVQNATKNEEGNKALEYSRNNVQKAEEAWNRFKNIGLSIGEKMLPVISTGLETVTALIQGISPVVDMIAPIIGGALSGVSLALEGITSTINFIIGLFSGWIGYLQDGNPIVWGCTTALVAYGAALAINTALTKKDIIWQGIKNGLTVASTTLTEGWAAAQALLNSALLANPLAWVIALVAGVAVGVYAAWQKFEGFRMAVLGVWEVIKEFGKSLWNAVITPIKQILKGIGSIGEAIVQLFEGNFGKAADAAKQGFKDIGAGMIQSSPVATLYNTWKDGDYATAWEKGKQSGRDSWAKSQAGKGNPASSPAQEKTEAAVTVQEPVKPVLDTEDLLKVIEKIGKSGKTGNKGKAGKTGKSAKTINLNDEATNYSQSAGYLAATRKMAASIALPAAMLLGSPQSAAAQDGGMMREVALPEVVITPNRDGLLPDPTEYQDYGRSQLTDSMFPEPGHNTVSVDRVCDQIIINVENTDGKGAEEIRSRILEVLNEIVEG